MRTRRLTLRAIMTLLNLTLAGSPAYMQESSNPPAPTHQKLSEPVKHQDAPAPEPHPELKPLVQTLLQLVDQQKHAEALDQAEALLQQAREKGDKVGQAYAHRYSALTLQSLRRMDEAAHAWEQGEQLWREIGDSALVVEATLGRAFCLWRADQEQGEQLLRQALDMARLEKRRPLAAARALRKSGTDWYAIRIVRNARSCFEEALTIYNRFAPDSLEGASVLNNLGAAVALSGNLREAQRCFEQALAIQSRLASGSLEHANTLNNLGLLAYLQGNLFEAQQYYEQALDLYNRLVPGSLQVAGVVNNLGSLANAQGNPDKALQYYEQALAIYRQASPNSLEHANTLNNVGGIAWVRGDLAKAQQCFEEALNIYNNLPVRPPEFAGTLANLGNIACVRGDLDAAQRHYQQALSLLQRLVPNSLDTARVVGNLANLAWTRGDLDAAQRYFEQALSIFKAQVPDSVDMALVLNGLGTVAHKRGELEKARDYYQQAIQIHDRLASNSLEFACVLSNQNVLLMQQGNYDQALEQARKVLAMREQLAPNSLAVASSLDILGRLRLHFNQLEEARNCFEKAVDIVERQRYAISDPEVRVIFGEEYFGSHMWLAWVLLLQENPASAAEVLERSRARSLAETLYQRALPRENLPRSLQELLKEQEQLNNQRLLVYQRLRTLKSDQDAEAIDALHKELTQLDQKQRALDARLRKEFPEFASQLLPEPLTIQQIQQSLDEGTVLLYHALVEDHLLIVAVSRTEVKGYVVEQGKQIEQQAKQFRELSERLGEQRRKEGLLTRPAPDRRELAQMGQQLYNQLLEPAQAMLQGARRVVLCPDGVLSQLPWAALVVKTENGRPVYWIEQVALHLMPSMGVYRHARKIQPARQGVLIAAVSEYRVQGEAQAPLQEEPRVALLPARRSEEWDDLPQVKEEAERLQKLFGAQAQALLEAEATPDKTRQTAQGKRVVHFAGHARANHADPLGSFLKLAPPLPDQGKLTAGDILTGWKLQADLVMLSACETGLGVTRRYEGVYSLARAFLYAGSRSVGASLWRVDDASTAQLMEAFYQRYQQGVAKDEALQQAQLGLLRKGYTDPYYWAGFVLIGDYRTELPRAGSANTLK